MKPIHVLSVASELYPLIKTGGLADVAGALPAALRPQGVRMVTLVPGYPAVLAALEGATPVARIDALMGAPATLLGGRAHGLDLLAIDAPHLYDRPGNPYLDAHGRDWPDNAQRFAALAQVAARIGGGLIAKYQPALIHVHDWQAALVPAYLHYGGPAGPPVVLTIHNLAFQGRFPPALLGAIGLPDAAFTLDGVEYYGEIGFLKAGILFADAITTVSPTYAAEIATDAGGMGLGGLLAGRADDLVGILNGIDTDVWDPARDALLPHRYSAARPEDRSANKAALQVAFGLDAAPDAPLFGVVSRLSEQKGLDLLLGALPELVAAGGQVALIGTGDAWLEDGFRAAAGRHPGRVGCLIAYDEARAHLLQAGCDALLVPSRFEPCGLTQLCALRYGAIPVVARTGGLADSVVDANEAALRAGVATGLVFSPIDRAGFAAALRRTIAAYRDPPMWKAMLRNGMRADVSWARSAQRYADLYRQLIDRER
jgi:starch synthase